MDEIVKAALAKWPNVPDCRGWLGLDARGDWYMRDAGVQAAGPFPASRGARVAHDRLRAFIERNYEADAHGAWFFQNGPQRVYVELEAAPWVWRVDPALAEAGRVRTHTGREARPQAVWLDEQGRVFLACDLGFGLVHTQDVLAVSELMERQGWPVQELPWAQMPGRFGFIASPQAGLAGPA